MKLACPSCGANVVYLEGRNVVFCETCKKLSDIKPLTEKLIKNVDSIEFEADVLEHTCNSCGAKIISLDDSMVNTCNFCGSVNFQTNKLKYKLKKSKVLPFIYDKSAFLTAFKEYISKNPVSNAGFFSEDKITKISGLYVPLSINNYDMIFDSTGNIRFDKKNQYGATKYKLYKYNYNADYSLTTFYDEVRNLPDYLLNNLMPFDIENSESFSPYYFAGFCAPKVDSFETDKVKPISKELFQIIEKTIKNEFDKAKRIETKINTAELNTVVRDEYYVPVWMCSYNYEGKIYSFVQNARNGKIISTLPVDEEKYKKIYLKAKRINRASLLASALLTAIELIGFSLLRATGPIITIYVLIIITLIVVFYTERKMEETKEIIKRRLEERINNIDYNKNYNYVILKKDKAKTSVEKASKEIKETKNSLKLNGSEID